VLAVGDGARREASEQRFSVSRKGGACLQGAQRVLGWPTDVCNGQYPGIFNSLVQSELDRGMMQYLDARQDAADQKAAMDDCTDSG